jgi:dipeptidyl aminopeptidase/acylaminoacyl peptidase
MSARFSAARLSARHVAGLLASIALAALLPAATPEPLLPELDEVLVIGEVPWPIDDYVEYPQFDSVVISPDGGHLATAWRADGVNSGEVSIIDLPSLKPRSGRQCLFCGGSLTPGDLRWVDENRLAIQPDWLWRGFRHQQEPYGTLIVIDTKNRILRELNPHAWAVVSRVATSVQRNLRDELRLVEQIVKQTGEGRGPLAFGPVKAVNARAVEPDRLLFQTLWTGEADMRGFGVFELDLKKCRQVRVASLPLRGGQVITGPGHRPALVVGVNEAHERVVYFLPEEARAGGRDWELVVRSDSGERGLLPLAWTGEEEKYYALDGRDLPTRAVVVWNARDNTHHVLYRHPDADMDSASLDPAGRPWLFSGIRHYPVHWYPDPAHPLAVLHQALVRRLPGEHVDILNATNDLATAVVRVSSGARPTVFLVVDVKSGRSLTSMYGYPKLQGRRISPVKAIEFTARDGLAIRGYLTTPLNLEGEPRRNRPLLVIAHDGPAGEFPDYQFVADARYDFERQLFASRGYAVLQVNVRGTGGRGMAFQRAGDGEWGRAVQDDYADAVRWAINEGVAADGRVCFYGTGYGAYSALMTAAREPDLFQCVIGIAGVYDLSRHVQGDKEQIRDLTVYVPSVKSSSRMPCGNMLEDMAREIVRPRNSPRQEIRRAVEALNAAPTQIPPPLQRAIGHDLEQLRARSPVSHAASIKAKVLLVHQFADKPAVEEQLAAMQSALRTARNPAQTGTIGRSSYYDVNTQRTDAYQTLLNFLGEQIGN